MAPVDPGPPLSLSAGLAANVTSYLGLAAAPELDVGALRLPRWEAVVALNPVSLSFGRGTVGYGLQGERGFVVAGGQTFDRLELATTRPLSLPGFLRYLGPVAFEGFVSRLTEARHAGDPFFWGGNLRLQPHPRFTLSLQRAVIVGGGRVDQGTQLNQVFKMLFGTKNQPENNVAGLSLRWRLPTETLLPLTTYAEWGMDDLGGELEAPGLLFGVRTPMLPGAPRVSLGAEFAFIGALCCAVERPSWYLHFNHVGGWVMQDAPIGHPLGGDGREYRVYASADLLEARLRIEGDALLRQRFSQNLYAPQRDGTSVGVSSRISWRVTERGELGLSLSEERGNAWREGTVQGRAALFF
nr:MULTISPECIES: capsule assembly Wzi family protein [Myxococcaceae]